VNVKHLGQAAPPRRPSALWLWSSTEASRALQSRDLALILRAYRRLNGLSQEQLAQLLGYDKTYISMIETRRRVIGDVATLRHIAHRLSIPVHILGVTEVDDATFKAMMQFADSVLSLADVARQTGRADNAINELWPLVARLEARAADGFVDRASLALLGKARASLGIALGTLLPEERLATAAKWTGQALVIAQRLDEPEFLAYTLSMHGNELRKAGRTTAAIERIRRSIAVCTDPAARTTALAFLARAAGEAGRAELFDSTMASYRNHLETVENTGLLSNRFTFHEVLLRGLVETGRARQAAKLMDAAATSISQAAAPQWTVIERVTAAEVLLANGDRDGAEEALHTALDGAEKYRLPHQVQRAIRIASGSVEAVADAGRAVLVRLDSRLGIPDS
jgi:transcriptional regulator with XRE-family HTH domain